MYRNGILFLIFALMGIALAVFVARKVDVGREVPEAAEKAEITRPPAEEPSPVVALVLDDFGYTRKNLEGLKGVGAPVTLAVLPNVPYSRNVCYFAKENGLEVILHLPMEPEGEEVHLENDTITGDMDGMQVQEILARDFDSVSIARGVSNHMGSKATKDARLMRVVFEDLKKRDMFFLDSYTTGQSSCKRMARDVGIPYARRDIFIDNMLDAGYIRRQMEKVEGMALRKGKVLAIGHDRGVTIEVLREVVPQMKERGIKFVTLSEYVENDR